MIVVSDTSPIHYLVLTGTVDVLDPLFGEAVIPPAVLRELRHAHAPEAVRHWAGALPEWVTVRSPARWKTTPIKEATLRKLKGLMQYVDVAPLNPEP